ACGVQRHPLPGGLQRAVERVAGEHDEIVAALLDDGVARVVTGGEASDAHVVSVSAAAPTDRSGAGQGRASSSPCTTTNQASSRLAQSRHARATSASSSGVA